MNVRERGKGTFAERQNGDYGLESRVILNIKRAQHIRRVFCKINLNYSRHNMLSTPLFNFYVITFVLHFHL
jgi:hypothetical protein